MSARLDKLRGVIAQEGLDCLVVSQPENRRYMSGFTGSAGVLAISAEQALLLTDFRYYTQAPQQAPDFALYPIKSRTEETLAEAL
ncbi:MAG: aminopeptidase P family N-terminal domain-containing protein, partial [Anaerolineales bacterium]